MYSFFFINKKRKQQKFTMNRIKFETWPFLCNIVKPVAIDGLSLKINSIFEAQAISPPKQGTFLTETHYSRRILIGEISLTSFYF